MCLLEITLLWAKLLCFWQAISKETGNSNACRYPSFLLNRYLSNSVNMQEESTMTLLSLYFNSAWGFDADTFVIYLAPFTLWSRGGCCISRVEPDRKGYKAVLIPEEIWWVFSWTFIFPHDLLKLPQRYSKQLLLQSWLIWGRYVDSIDILGQIICHERLPCALENTS